VRRLDFVKKKSQTRSITPDAARDAIAAGVNWPNIDQSRIVPLVPKKTWSLARTHSRHPTAMAIPSGLAPSAFRRNPYVTLSLNSKSNFFPSVRMEIVVHSTRQQTFTLFSDCAKYLFGYLLVRLYCHSVRMPIGIVHACT